MALHIEFRNGTASSWTSANPILSIGEIGVETDTGKFKIGDGATSWSSLSYAGSTGGTQTQPFRSFGDGSDGSVTISSGTTTLTRDMFYNNLTMSGTGTLVTNGYKVFIKGILDLQNAQAGAIQWNGNNGASGSGSTAGAAPSAQAGATVGNIMVGGTGSSGTTGTGTNGTAGTVSTGNGGLGGAGGRGGIGDAGASSAATNQRSPTNINFVRIFKTDFLYGATLVGAGAGGSEGSAGSGDGSSNSGGGSGSGGNGGGTVAIFANIIVKGSSTPAGTIQAKGGNGGNGGNSSAGNTGGGGGAGGGGGGWIYFCYNFKFGPDITNFFDASGGLGGIAGNGFGTGSGGTGGDSGTGGRILALNIPNNTSKSSLGNTNATIDSSLTGTVGYNIMLSGGDGGINGYSKLNF